MRAHGFAFFLTLASFGFAGCAAEAGEQAEKAAMTQADLRVTDQSPAELAAMHSGIGGRGGVTMAGDHERRMYEFSSEPRIAEREPYEVNLTAMRNALVVPHAGTLKGREIAANGDTDCGVTCAAP